jgi:hypothetical protein
MRQEIVSSFRISPPTTNRAILLILAVFLAPMVAALALAVAPLVLRDFVAASLHAEPWKLIVFVLPVGLIAFVIWKGLCFTDGSLERVDVGPEGILVHGLFGLRYRRWEDIDHFTVGVIPVKFQVVAVTARPKSGSEGRKLRFYLSGCFETGWFDDIEMHQDAVAYWLQELAAAYTRGSRGGGFPLPPAHFKGRLIPLPPGSMAARIAVMTA